MSFLECSSASGNSAADVVVWGVGGGGLRKIKKKSPRGIGVRISGADLHRGNGKCNHEQTNLLGIVAKSL